MAEETEGQETGSAATAAGVDPAAVALALGGASREKADAFLEDQRAVLRKQGALLDTQQHHLHEQFKKLRLSIWEQRMGLLLRVATGFVGTVVAAGLALIIWDAAHADGLVIDSFSVPPDLANRGLTGDVIASQVLDKIASMQSDTRSLRPAQSYSNNIGNDIKVEIPDTGVSVGEAYRFLRGWLGHETHITGEVYRTTNGIAVTARAGVNSAATYTGSEADLDALVQKVAENVYRNTQPNRYADYLFRRRGANGTAAYVMRVEGADEARQIYVGLTNDPDPLERAWAWNNLSVLESVAFANDRSMESDLKRAISEIPDFTPAYRNLQRTEHSLGHTEAELAASQNFLRLIGRESVPDVDKHSIAGFRLDAGTLVARLHGDFTNAAILARSGAELTDPDAFDNQEYFRQQEVEALAQQHDKIGTVDYLRSLPPLVNGTRADTIFYADAYLQDWQAVIASEESTEKQYAEANRGVDMEDRGPNYFRYFLALAKAKLGDTAGAEAVIATTASDCYNCIRMRGNIAAVEGNWRRADYWFARAIHDGPSIPFAYADWGQMLLQKGDPDGAIVKFTVANQKGPKFADPLEWWGEALMKKNRSDLALAKFTEANKYAPNWGRLHLKWGEALGYAGKKDEAQKQYTLAAGLDLSNADKAELAKVNHG